jgi:hypothetical protein
MTAFAGLVNESRRAHRSQELASHFRLLATEGQA